MTSYRLKRFKITWALAQLFKVDYKYISHISINDQAADGEFLKSVLAYLKSVWENPVYKLESEILFLIQPKYNSTQIQQLQH